MYADQQSSRRSHRRRPDLVVNTSRATTASHPPLSSPFRIPPVPGARGSSRNYRTATMTTTSTSAPAAAGAAASMDPGPSQAPKTAAALPSHAPAPTEVETFLEMYTPVDSSANKENTQPMAEPPPMPDQRDSHDLSLPSRHVRDSLVSNMLLSLDQFSMGQMGQSDDQFAPASTSTTASRNAASFDDPRLYSLSTTTATDEIARLAHAHASSSSRNGGGGPGSTTSTIRHAYSYSSDYDGGDDASRVSGGAASRGRRSNSSSGFQPGLGRINSMRESGSQPATPRMVHSRGAKGSKSSSTNSIDTSGYAQVLGSQRWVHGIGARSSSFDMGQRPIGGPLANGGATAPLTSAALSNMALPNNGVLTASSASNIGPPHPSSTAPKTSAGLAPTTANGGQPWHVELSNTFFSDVGYDDSAPTPTVPAGPRKLTSVPSMPSIPSFKAPVLEPVQNTRSPSRSPERHSVRSGRSATVGRQAQAKYNNNNPPPLPQTAPVLPALDLDSAPAPHIGYEKSKEAAIPAPGQQHAHQQKERPGFFRRMFGTLRDTVSNNEPAALTGAVSSGNPYVSGGNPPDTAKSHSTPPSRENMHNSIQKKPSGFFRRRKKSVSEMESYPPLPNTVLPQAVQPPTPLQSTQPTAPQSAPLPSVPPIRAPGARDFVEQPNDSPVTSLRKAMNPYLKGSPAFTNGPSSLNPDSLAPRHDSSTAATAQDYEDDADTVAPYASNRKERERLDDTSDRNGRGFSPDYEPSPNATIRSVSGKGKEKELNTKTSKAVDKEREKELQADMNAEQGAPLNRTETPAQQPSKTPHPARSGSFLSDTSDSEESPKRTRDQNKAPRATVSTSSMTHSMLLSPNAANATSKKATSHSNDRSLDETRSNQLTLPIEGAVTSSKNNSLSPQSALSTSSTMPNIKIEGVDRNLMVKTNNSSNTSISAYHSIDEPEFVVGDPTEDDRSKALSIFQGNEDFIQKDRAAAYMGEEGPIRQRTLQAYMDLYDFSNMSILSALREVCRRLVLRAETQQVDRILVSFSKRWCTCNPRNGFKTIDVIHTTCYSIMLLNTDLHLADIETKMTRGQFIKNTMTSIRHTLTESAPGTFARPTILPNKTENGGRPSMEPNQSASANAQLRSESSLGHHHEDCGPLVRAPFDGPIRQWEAQVEIVLKDIYASIRDERLPLFGAGDGALHSQGLSVMGMLKRTPSVLSKAPSESQVSTRGRINEGNARNGTSRWTSKSRSRARLQMGGIVSNGFSSSRTSFEDNNSIWSPAGSSATWSKQSLGRTQTSMSMESFGSSWARGDYQQSIGFANALSQAIIREDAIGSGAASIISDDQSHHNADGQLLEDDSLELAGPPWVKEGIVTHKHHLDGMDKKAKDRNWTEVFAVIQKGSLSLFSFTPNKSLRVKARGRNNTALPKGAVVGGGNWQENATNLGSFGLKQTLASALPPPGYSSRRPHVWALSLPTGAVHLFQVGTPEICKEFVTTANYWSARLSTHPLIGGISNVEYGWSDNIVNNALVAAINETNTSSAAASRPGSAAAGRSSMQSRRSIRSGSFDFGHSRTGSSSSGLAATATAALHSSGGAGRHGGKLPGDRVHIAEWLPPAQSLRGSTSAEGQQLHTLLAYVKGIEEDLQAHNALRSPMLLAFTPRGPNAAKAMSNWERKSSYLLREIVKYRTYVDCLTEAERRRNEVYQERDIARRAARGDDAPMTDTEESVSTGHGVDDDSANDTGDNTDVTLRA